MAKPGDIVRFLNSTGGGRITRIENQIAYVTDDDGFDVPMLLRECVVVAEAESEVAKIKAATPAAPAPSAAKPQAATAVAREEIAAVEEQLPVVETPEGDTINLTIGFEPADIKSLSTTTFDMYLVNDSNYYILFSFATRDQLTDRWTLRYAGTVEPNIQLFMAELTRDQLTAIERISFQYVAFKEQRPFELKTPGAFEAPFDNTKFFKLHCFKPNVYFDKDVIAVPVVKNDVVCGQEPDTPSPARLKELEKEMNRKKNADRRPVRKNPQPKQKDSVRRRGEVIEVDLHIDELVDTTAGLSPADMLNLQIDTFRRVMDQNLRNHGQRIVFIHGKGEGVLRNALAKELTHRYKGHDVQDASFQEYGYGATQVTIR